MIHTDERLLEQAAAWREAGRKVALATVVSTWGSSPRPAGSMLIVDEAGEMQGSVSGGCIEGAVIREAHGQHGGRAAQAARVRRLERAGLGCGPRLRRPGPGLGRGGGVNLELLAALNEARAAKRRVCLVRYLDDGGEALVVDGRTVRGEVPADVAAAVDDGAAARPVDEQPRPAAAARSCRCSTRPCG